MEAPLYNQQGEKVGTVTLPEHLFGVRWNADLVHQVVEGERSSRRAGTAHAKGRSEVRGGGRKPWRQKGTGRARHGSIRSPIWIGGGVTHGPRSERNFTKKVNKAMKKKALGAILSQKLRDGEILFVEKIAFSEPKTKVAQKTFTAFRETAGFPNLGEKGGRALLLLPKSEPQTIRAIRNLPFMDADEFRNLNPERALEPKFLVIEKDALLAQGK